MAGTVDQKFDTVAKHLRGFDTAMVETAYRYNELYWAAQDANWGYADYQIKKIRTAVENGLERRPTRAASAETFLKIVVPAVEEAIRRRDGALLRERVGTLRATCNTCHHAEKVEFVHIGEGLPLAGPMSTELALPLAQQIASALESAHSRGILHRDLKPANVVITEAGAKLLDFGLAKLTTDADLDATRTTDGVVMGTAAYMSPEQARGKPVDARSDIFSFGAVLYEMVSGQRAFGGASFLETLHAVVEADPAALDSPLFGVIKRCLAKDASQRFPSAVELRAALAGSSPTPRSDQRSIAVLPFANMSRDADDDYFSDGLAEEIINALVKVPGLKVIARTSAFAFKGQNTDIRRIAEILGVTNVLRASTFFRWDA